MKVEEIINTKKAKKDKNNIWVTDLITKEEIQTSRNAWEKIYNFNLKQLKKDRADFNRNKLKDHMSYLEKTFAFNKNTVYLEIGCGPAYIAEYLMKKYDVFFIGVDFNYAMLLTLREYLLEKGLRNFAFIHADINDMPLKNNSVDYVYGGGVIEHFSDTKHILNELYRVLKREGICFNTIPAFNLMWLMRFWNNIPSVKYLKNIFEIIHIKILKNKLLETYHGYELSYTARDLTQLHKKAKFRKIKIGAFSFHPSEKKIKNKILRSLYFNITSINLLSPVYYVSAKK